MKLIRYGLGVAALAWIIQQAAWGRVVETIGGMNRIAVTVILVLTVLEVLSRFAMWHVLLNALRRTPFSTAARATLTVSFVNQVIPSRVSGRSLAPVVLRQYTRYDWSELVPVAGFHTALYAVLNGAVALFGLALFASSFSKGLLIAVSVSAALYLVVGPSILLMGIRLEGAGRVAVTARNRVGVERIPLVGSFADRFFGALPNFGADAADTFERLATDYSTIALYASGWTFAMMVVPGVRTWLLLDAAGVGFSSPVLLPVALITAYTVTLLPLTPGGVGVAEASATLVLAALGVPAAVAAPTILIDRFLGVYLPAFAGWVPAMRLDVSSVLSDQE
ncbi:lysylphosphatidylglycerol synthase transmembrane domain-containing protein [Haladaptatus pallidirubidus]|uniref:lysylphosphatidylglycerol synthase transmembrane domain-containing protein n=1 Tax=Haladaptatus pallidirubidus TaxID=1008152 RepID=UPI001D0F5731|nr:lysylphosphatidylglycerol synthase transmembrane domain-containing protein [Haladaptatus pallidirubidus]